MAPVARHHETASTDVFCTADWQKRWVRDGQQSINRERREGSTF